MLGIDIGNWIVITVFSFGLIMWLREKRAERAKSERGASPQTNEPETESTPSRIPTTSDPEQSQISYYGAAGLRVEVYIMIENGLDIEAKLRKLELVAEVANERLDCRFVAFQPGWVST